jgi:hypothetical protein
MKTQTVGKNDCLEIYRGQNILPEIFISQLPNSPKNILLLPEEKKEKAKELKQNEEQKVEESSKMSSVQKDITFNQNGFFAQPKAPSDTAELTPSEIGMIQHCLLVRTIKLLRYFIESENDEKTAYEHVDKMMEKLYSDLVPPPIKRKYTRNSDEMFLTPVVFSIIQYELYGIFHPDFKVLNILNVFSLIRNTRKQSITESEFDKFKNKIREYAYECVKKIITRKAIVIAEAVDENKKIQNLNIIQ